MHYINKIKFLCDKRKVTIRKLAQEIGVSEIGLHKMISNNSMKVETLQKIADYFELPVSSFFEDSNTKNTINIDVFLAGLKEVVLERIEN